MQHQCACSPCAVTRRITSSVIPVSLHRLNKHNVRIKLNFQCQHKDKITHTNRISRHPAASSAQAHFLPSRTFHLFHFVPLSSNIPSLLSPPHPIRPKKVHTRTGHEGPDGKEMYSSTLSLTSALDAGGRSTPRPGRFTPGKEPVPIVQEAGWAPGPVWTGAETLVPHQD